MVHILEAIDAQWNQATATAERERGKQSEGPYRVVHSILLDFKSSLMLFARDINP